MLVHSILLNMEKKLIAPHSDNRNIRDQNTISPNCLNILNSVVTICATLFNIQNI
jgi:hypothetical protein